MSVAVAVAVTGRDTVDGTLYTTASVTAQPGRLYILSVVGQRNGTIGALTAVGGTLGIDWGSPLMEQTYTSTHYRHLVYAAALATTASSAGGTITFGWAGSNLDACSWILLEVTGMAQDTSNTGWYVQAVTGFSAAALSINLAALLHSGNTVFQVISHNQNTGTSPKAGLTEIADVVTSSTINSGHEAAYATPGQTAMGTTSPAGDTAGIAFEVAPLLTQAVGGAITPTGALSTFFTRALAVAGSITPTGTMTTLYYKALAVAGSITPTGSLVPLRVRRLLTALVEGALSLVGRSESTLTLTQKSEDTLHLTELDEEDA